MAEEEFESDFRHPAGADGMTIRTQTIVTAATSGPSRGFLQ